MMNLGQESRSGYPPERVPRTSSERFEGKIGKTKKSKLSL
jgi:hypothetical protein